MTAAFVCIRFHSFNHINYKKTKEAFHVEYAIDSLRHSFQFVVWDFVGFIVFLADCLKCSDTFITRHQGSVILRHFHDEESNETNIVTFGSPYSSCLDSHVHSRILFFFFLRSVVLISLCRKSYEWPTLVVEVPHFLFSLSLYVYISRVSGWAGNKHITQWRGTVNPSYLPQQPHAPGVVSSCLPLAPVKRVVMAVARLENGR